MQTHDLAIATSFGTFAAYLALPQADVAPGIIVIQEIFGINPFIRSVVHRYVEAGYVTIAPDLFWRQAPGIQLDDQDEGDRSKAFDLYARYNEDQGIEDLTATLNFLRHHPRCNGKVGSVGFCLGGKLAYLMATRTNTDCNVSYYGVGIERNLTEQARIQAPLLLHLAERDQFVPPEAQAAIQSALSPNSLITLYSYPRVSHAFARPGGHAYNPELANLANDRTQQFLQQFL